MVFCGGIVRDSGSHRSRRASRVRRRQTHLRGRNARRLCLGDRRCLLGVCGPRRRPRNSSVPLDAARQKSGLDPWSDTEMSVHGRGTDLAIRSAVPVKARLGERAVSTRFLVIAGCRCRSERPGRETPGQYKRTRSGTPTQRDQAGSSDAFLRALRWAQADGSRRVRPRCAAVRPPAQTSRPGRESIDFSPSFSLPPRVE